MISTFFVYRSAFVPITGEQPSASDDQAIWDRFRQLTEGLQPPGGSRLIENYDELCTYYDRVVAREAGNDEHVGVRCARHTATLSPRLSPRLSSTRLESAQPDDRHVLGVLGFGIMRPSVRALVPMTWSPRHDLEFAVLTTAIRLAYDWLPTRFTHTPLARNRREYQRLMDKYRGIGLASFVPDHPPRSVTSW